MEAGKYFDVSLKLKGGDSPRTLGRLENGDSEAEDEDSMEDVCAKGTGSYVRTMLSEIFLGSKMNVLLLALPFALLARPLGFSEAETFTAALLALIPLAERISFVTEDVAKYTNDTVGGLLNATFGNVTELVVCIFAIRAGLLRVVQVSMLGSVLSNLLLVLGSAFLVGGIKHKEQKFNKVAAVTNSGLLCVATLGLALPSLLDATHSGSGGTHEEIVRRDSSGPSSWLSGRGSLEEEEKQGGDAPIWLSRWIAGMLLALYGMLIVFQLETHTYLFNGGDEEEEEDPGILGLWGGLAWLAGITVFISLLSDIIVTTIEEAATDMGVPILFLSGILVPIVGNAAEHAAAIIFAWRNKMEICLGSAVGSAVQISVFVIPLCVMIGWLLGQPMTLNFHIFETALLLLTVVSVAFVLMDGRSHWLKGAMLLFSYFMIAATFWAHADPLTMA